MKTILLATDGSPSAQQALVEAVELAKATRWRLRVLTVWRTPIPPPYGYAAIPYLPEIGEERRAEAEAVAQAAAAAAAEHGVRATWEVREGRPADEISAVAAARDAHVIVIGAHGWGPVKRMVFGSVSTAVLHDAPCPVLVVRALEAERTEQAGEAHLVASGVTGERSPR